MNLWTTIILIVLVAVCGLVIYLAVPDKPAIDLDDSSDTPKAQYVFEPRPAETDIVRVHLERAGKPRVVFERQPQPEGAVGQADWKMREPIEALCDRYSIPNLARFFLNAQSERRYEPGGEIDAAKAGLDKPAAVVTVVDQAGREYKLEIGGKVAMSSATYVRAAGSQTIHVINRDFGPQIDKEINDFRDKRLVPLVATDARRVEIQHDGKTYTFTRAGEDWKIESPVNAGADATRMRGLLGKIATLRAVEFVADAPESLSQYGLDEPYIHLTVRTEKEPAAAEGAGAEEGAEAPPKPEPVVATYDVLIGAYADMQSENRFAKLADQPWVATVTKASADALLPKLSELRDSRVTRMKATEVTALEYTVGDQTITLNKVDGRWQGTGDLAELETAAVIDMLEAFEDLKANDFIDGPADAGEYGLDQPRSIVKVSMDGVQSTLHVGGKTASGRNSYARLEGQPSVLVIPTPQADRLAVAPLSLRSRDIFRLPAGNLRELGVTRGDVHYQLARDGGAWSMSEPAGAPVDPETIRVLTTNLANLRAKLVAGKGDDATFGLAAPAVTIRFTVAPPPPATQSTQSSQPAEIEPAAHTLVVGRQGSVTYCRKDDDPYVFELDSTVYDVLVQELIDRNLFDFAADDLVTFRVEAPGGTLELTRADKQWTYDPDPYVKLAQKRIDEFAQVLAGLRVDSWLRYRDADLAALGLEDAPVTVTLRMVGGRQITLKIAQEQRGSLPRRVGWVEENRAFRLRAADAEKLLRGLDAYVLEQPAAPVGGDN